MPTGPILNPIFDPAFGRLVTGTSADETLNGRSGNGQIKGAKGLNRDRIDGGSGDDTFVFAPNDGPDAIVDFTLGEDIIDLTAYNLSGIANLVLIGEGNNTRVLTSATDEIYLEGTSLNHGDSDAFLF